MPMKYPSHPGRIIRTSMEALCMSVAETAQRLGVSAVELKSVIDGEASVTPELAVELDKLIGGGVVHMDSLADSVRRSPGAEQRRRSRRA